MEDEKEAIHSEPATSTITTTNPDPEQLANSSPADDPPPPPPPSTAVDGGIETEEEEDQSPAAAETETTTTSNKRRKVCPRALEKWELPSSCSPSNCFSFTFDPKFSCGVSTPQVTPKFGSFNSVPPAAKSAEIEAKSEQEEQGGEKRVDDEVEEQNDFLDILAGCSSNDDGGISADFFEDGSNVFL